MKKTLTTLALCGATIGAFAQGTVTFENSAGNGNITFAAGGTIAAGNANPGTYTLALLYNPATSGTVAQSALTQIATYSPTQGAASTGPGFFFDPMDITTPAGSGSAIFEVVGWVGNFTTWAAASAAGSGATYLGQTAEFVNSLGNPAANPAVAPAPLNAGNPVGGWDGNLVFQPVTTPEPTTIALGGLGAAALLAFRRRK